MLRIKWERLEKGWNQLEPAYRSRISVPDYGRIENGRMKPYPSQLKKLAAVFGLSAEELLEDVPAEGPVHAPRRTADPAPAA